MSTPAGWYPDPTGRHANRWFDGNDWTDQVADGQAVGIDPVRGLPPAAAAATQVVPVTAAQPGPPPGAPGVAPGATPAAGQPGTPPPGAPFGTYPGPAASGSGGGRKTLLVVGAVIVVLAVVVGLIVALGGGDDGDSTAGSSDSSEQDQSDAPEDTVDDPSASDLFDDMAGTGDQNDDDVFGTDEDQAEPADTSVDGGYPQEVIDNFTNSCTGAGSSASFCGCVIDELQANVPYDRFVEIDQELAENPGDVPNELTDAAAACQ